MHTRGGRRNTMQIAKSESQRTSPSVWASSPPGPLVHAAPRGLAAAQFFYVGAILNRDPTVRGKEERKKFVSIYIQIHINIHMHICTYVYVCM